MSKMRKEKKLVIKALFSQAIGKDRETARSYGTVCYNCQDEGHRIVAET